MSNLQEVNRNAYMDAVKRFESARQMFNYATDPKTIDIAIAMENSAREQMELYKELFDSKDYIRQIPIKKESFFKRFILWIQTPYPSQSKGNIKPTKVPSSNTTYKRPDGVEVDISFLDEWKPSFIRKEEVEL